MKTVSANIDMDVTDHFHSRALYRLFICDPELYKITSPLPHILRLFNSLSLRLFNS